MRKKSICLIPENKCKQKKPKIVNLISVHSRIISLKCILFMKESDKKKIRNL